MYWIATETGKIFTSGGKTFEDAEFHAARSVSSGGPLHILDTDHNLVSIVRASDVARLDPDPITKKYFKQRVKEGMVFKAIHINLDGPFYVASESPHGGRWVARVLLKNGYVKKVIR